MKITYNEKDISNIDLTSLVMYDRLGGVLDNLVLQFPLNMTVQKDDVIKVETDDFSSGEMFVESYSFSSSLYTLTAISCSSKNKKTKSKIWRNVRLLEVMNDVAINYGLTLKTYNITDYSYETISQINETDMSMLDRICKREGYSIKIDNGCLIVFNDSDLESQKASLIFHENEVREDYSFQTGKFYSSYTVSYYDTEKGFLSHTENEKGDGISYIKKEYLSNMSEAMRFSKNYLRNANKNEITGTISIDYNPTISAGTVIELKDFAKFNGKYIVYEVAQNVLNKITKMKVRRCKE